MFETSFSSVDGPKQCQYIENELCRPNHLHPEDSRNLETVQNFVEVDVSRTDAVAFEDEEDEKLEYHAKEDVIKFDTAAAEDVVQKLSIL